VVLRQSNDNEKIRQNFHIYFIFQMSEHQAKRKMVEKVTNLDLSTHNLDNWSHVDKRDLILSALNEGMIQVVDLYSHFVKMNEIAGVRFDVQPIIKQEGEDENVLLNYDKETPRIPSSFGKTSQSGALLRYSLHPEALMYRHTLELSLFIFQSFYFGDEDRKSYANNFILGRKKQLKTWIDLGHMFLGQQSQGVRSLLPPPEMLLPPPSSDLPIDELPETELDTSDDDKDEDEGECHFAHARQTTRGWVSD
jgi:hypothetical protein